MYTALLQFHCSFFSPYLAELQRNGTHACGSQLEALEVTKHGAQSGQGLSQGGAVLVYSTVIVMFSPPPSPVSINCAVILCSTTLLTLQRKVEVLLKMLV